MGTRGALVKKYSSKPTITALQIIGGNGTKYLGIIRDSSEAISVADVPTRMSIGPRGLPIFESRHPTTRPGIAAGVKYGSTVRISAIRNCTAP